MGLSVSASENNTLKQTPVKYSGTGSNQWKISAGQEKPLEMKVKVSKGAYSEVNSAEDACTISFTLAFIK